MPSYETLCILQPELPETRVKEIEAWMQKIIENGQGTVLQMEEWGMRDLAYRVHKQRRGYYVRVEYDSQPLTMKELERNLRLSEDVLRFLSVVCSVSPSTSAQPQSAAPAQAQAEILSEGPQTAEVSPER